MTKEKDKVLLLTVGLQPKVATDEELIDRTIATWRRVSERVGSLFVEPTLSDCSVEWYQDDGSNWEATVWLGSGDYPLFGWDDARGELTMVGK